jgi:hypothetical protein
VGLLAVGRLDVEILTTGTATRSNANAAESIEAIRKFGEPGVRAISADPDYGV